MIAAVLWFGGQATFPPTLPAPTTSARNPNVTPSITSEASIHPTPAPGSETGGALDTRRPGKADIDPGCGLPACACHVSVLLLADCSLRCVCWLGSSSQAEQACRSLGVWKSQKGQWEGGDPRGPSAQPPGVGVVGVGGGSACWSHSGSDVTFKANKTCGTCGKRRWRCDEGADIALNLI